MQVVTRSRGSARRQLRELRADAFALARVGAAPAAGACWISTARPRRRSPLRSRSFRPAPRRGEDAAYGASLANLRSGVTDRASLAASAAPMSPKRQAELTLSILAQQATAAFADGRYVEAILALDERARLAPEQTDLLMLRGWSYYKLGRYPDARRIFAGSGPDRRARRDQRPCRRAGSPKRHQQAVLSSLPLPPRYACRDSRAFRREAGPSSAALPPGVDA